MDEDLREKVMTSEWNNMVGNGMETRGTAEDKWDREFEMKRLQAKEKDNDDEERKLAQALFILSLSLIWDKAEKKMTKRCSILTWTMLAHGKKGIKKWRKCVRFILSLSLNSHPEPVCEVLQQKD
jgi:hypothetical protein